MVKIGTDTDTLKSTVAIVMKSMQTLPAMPGTRPDPGKITQ